MILASPDLLSTLHPAESTLDTKLNQARVVPRCIPYEILWNIAHFLDRDEIEKCQLVCQNWNKIIENGTKFLPLRFLEQLRFNSDGRILLYRYTKIPIATYNIGNLWAFNIQSIEFDAPESSIDFLIELFECMDKCET